MDSTAFSIEPPTTRQRSLPTSHPSEGPMRTCHWLGAGLLVMQLLTPCGNAIAGFAVENVFQAPLPYKAPTSSPNDPTYLSVAVGAGDTLHLAVDCPGGALYYARSSGSGWQIETIDSTGGSTYGGRCAIALGPDGEPRVVFFNSLTLNSGVLFSSRSGGSWSQPEFVVLGASSNPVDRLRLSIDANGTPHLAYPDNGFIWYTRRDSSGWSPAEPLNSGGSPTLALDANGTPRITFFDSGVVKLATRVGSGWSIQPVFDPVPNPASALPSIACPRDTMSSGIQIVHLLADGSLMHSEAVGGGWVSTGIGAAAASPGPILRLGAGGAPKILHKAANIYTLSKRSGNGWLHEQVSSELGEDHSYALGVDSSDQAHVFYQVRNVNGSQAGAVVRHAWEVPSVGITPRTTEGGTFGFRVSPSTVTTGQRIALTFTGVSGGATTTVQLLDISGRKLATLAEVTGHTTGEVVAHLPDGLMPGLYMVVAHRGGALARARIAVLR